MIESLRIDLDFPYRCAEYRYDQHILRRPIRRLPLLKMFPAEDTYQGLLDCPEYRPKYGPRQAASTSMPMNRSIKKVLDISNTAKNPSL